MITFFLIALFILFPKHVIISIIVVQELNKINPFFFYTICIPQHTLYGLIQHYMTSFDLLLSQSPFPEDHRIYNFGKGIPGLHNYKFSFSYTCVGVEKRNFERNFKYFFS